MTSAEQESTPKTFELSFENFATKASEMGWVFWRGYILGVLSTAGIAYPLMRSLS